MQLVIDISDESYATVLVANAIGTLHEQALIRAIKEGIVLSKGHGRLVDVSTLDDTVLKLNNERDAEITRYDYKRIDNVLFEMPTVVAADKTD